MVFSCFVIGGDTLLIECCEILRRGGWEIRGVISAEPHAISWSGKLGIPVMSPRSDYAATMRTQPFDYLFSIGYLSVIPESILALPSCGAINFHDGLLPRYAGLNTPVWALIEGASEYGITWHTMTARVDRGETLEEVRFTVDPEETSLSLNTRCFEAGLESFSSLIESLTAGTCTPMPQRGSDFHFYAHTDRPAAACLLNWERPASELAALVRALDFGTYANPIGSAKLLTEKGAWVVKSAVVHDGDGVPGTVTGIDAAGISVATGRGRLLIRSLATQAGEDLDSNKAALELGLSSGDRLLFLEDRERLIELDKALARSEGFWTRRLAKVEALEPALAKPGAKGGPYRELSLRLPSAARAVDEHFVIAVFGAFLARVDGHHTFYSGFSDTTLREQTAGLTSVLAGLSPLRYRVAPTATIADLLKQTAKELDRVRKHGPWLRDAVGRSPELRSRHALAQEHPFGVVVSIGPGYHPGGETILAFAWDGDARLLLSEKAYGEHEAAALQTCFQTFLDQLETHPDRPTSHLEILDEATRARVLVDWNRTAQDYSSAGTVVDLFQAQAARTPQATALVFADSSYTYAELDAKSNQLAGALGELGVEPGMSVGIYLDRSQPLPLAMLGINKAGAAWLPLDPSFPVERIRHMVDDAQVQVVVTSNQSRAGIPEGPSHLVSLDNPQLASRSAEPPTTRPRPDSLAYLIYTSGSTGLPKGVMIAHRNLVNFFVGMDPAVPHDPPGSWLSVTSISFDIAVLELLWTLTRGFQVVILDEKMADENKKGPMEFGLFYFSADATENAQEKYKLLLEGARYADENAFSSVWTPERHFHEFGGLYPDPAVTGAAVAAITKNVDVRAGSVVLPLHHPARVAETWSVVDNLCGGRAGIAFAAGWAPTDFLLQPQNFKEAKKVMFENIEIVRRLWRGEEVSFPGATGSNIGIRTLPRALQPELPVWVTTAGNPDTFRKAGEIGGNVLTHLLGQTVGELGAKVKAYRDARAEAGHDPATGTFTLMLHTLVGPDLQAMRDLAREPMKKYLGTALSLHKQYAWAFPAFKRHGDISQDKGDDLAHLTPEEEDGLLEAAFNRYFDISGLFGPVDKCLDMVNRLREVGVNEIGCLIDFGIASDKVLEHLPYLNEVRRKSNENIAQETQGSKSLHELVEEHGVTHMQCTPSMAQMMLANNQMRNALGKVKHMMVGGEAFPATLAAELDSAGVSWIRNMYGPTETTIWSSSVQVQPPVASVSIGKPIANTSIYILDATGRPVAPGQPGELCIGGHGVTRGYLRRPSLTAERFVPNPFEQGLGDGVPASGDRLYRTGDLARFGEDGTIHFLGRTDHQVKLRGYRIELGEIEAHLNRHGQVREAVVLAREDQPGNQRLVAYLVPAESAEEPAVQTLRDHLRETLPEYMVPANFVVLERFPLTPNSKIDRKALPAPDALAARSKVVYAPPENETEAKITGLWAELLGRERVGIDDNFFDIGGHSLMVVRMHRGLEKLLERSLVLTDLYKYTTVRKLTDYMETGGDTKQTLDKSKQRAQKRLGRRARRR